LFVRTKGAKGHLVNLSNVVDFVLKLKQLRPSGRMKDGLRMTYHPPSM
jgi:hypothetical protein